jgi:hypothetical protein
MLAHPSAAAAHQLNLCIAHSLTLFTMGQARVTAPGRMLPLPVACEPAQHMTCQICMLAGLVLPPSSTGTASPESLMLHSCCHSWPLYSR